MKDREYNKQVKIKLDKERLEVLKRVRQELVNAMDEVEQSDFEEPILQAHFLIDAWITSYEQ